MLEIQTFWSLDFEWLGLEMVGPSYSYSHSPDHSKTEE